MLFAKNIPPVGRAVQCLVVAVILGATSAAVADVAISEIVLQIQASNTAGSGVLEISLDSLTWDGQTQSLSWESAAAADIVDSETNAVIATLSNATVEFRGCSEVAFGFQLEAGNSDTTVVVRTGQLSFASIGSGVAEGRATAAFSLRDLNGDGAQMLGLGGGGMGAYRAYFNGAAPDGSLFTHLVALVSVGAGGTGSGSQQDPMFGYRAIGADVGDMSAEAAFTLTALDRLTASTTFDIDPDPSDCGDDADGDGLPDWLDGCPDDPDKIEPGECGCGVADDDSDGDGVADCNDNCPYTANPDQEDADGDGVGDACDEPDDDGGDIIVDPDPDDEAESLEDAEPADESPDADSGGPGGAGSGAEDGLDREPGSGGQQWGDLLGLTPPGEGDGDEAVYELMSGVAGLCGFGAAGLLPLTLLGLSGFKAVGRRSRNRR